MKIHFIKIFYKFEESYSYLVYEPHKELIKKKYFKINTYKAINDENRKLLNDLEEILFTSLEKRIYSSPSALLSGGVESLL